MSLVHKRLGSVLTSPTANTATTIYTVPAGKTAIIKELILSSDNASASDATIYLDGFYHVRKLIPGGGATIVLPSSTVMHAGNVLTVNPGSVSASTYFQASGWEFSTPTTRSIPQKYKSALNNTNTTLFTVAAGKRFIIKELVFTHNAAVAVSVYIPSVINVFRTTVPGGDTVFHSCDTVVEAGQSLVWAANNFADITLSGLLEDV